MKFTKSILFLLFISQISIAQEIAVTERGDSVYLYSNGTWDYYDNFINFVSGKQDEDFTEIKMNDKSFKKPKSSNKKINGSNQAYEIWYNDKVWKRIPVGELNSDADIALQLIKGDLYAMVIYEEIEIPIKNLSQIAFDNMASSSPDTKTIEKEYRIINNDTLIYSKVDATVQGMKISYFTYFFSNNNGSIQFHTFTGQNLANKYLNSIEEMLNGLVIKNNK